jgi:protein SCO1/2
MRRSVAALALLVVCAGCGSSSSVQSPQAQLRGTELSPPSAAPSFTLEDQSGRAVSLAAQRGHYVVVTFLYTHCPDVCPVIAGNLNRALATPVARRAGLRVLAVSVDPKRDTPRAVRRYVRVHRLLPAFRYLTGSQAQLERVWKAYHVAAQPGPKNTVTHSTFELLVDPQGRERVAYDSTIKTADVVHDLARLEAG